MILAKHNTARLILSVICQPSRVTTIVLETLLAAPHLSKWRAGRSVLRRQPKSGHSGSRPIDGESCL